MEINKNKKSVKFQGDMLNFCDFIQVFVFTRNHHLKLGGHLRISTQLNFYSSGTALFIFISIVVPEYVSK